MRRVTWEVRSDWEHLGSELGISSDTLKVFSNVIYIHCLVLNTLICDFLQEIQATNKERVDECHTHMLIHWFRQPPPKAPIKSAMIDALRSDTVNHSDIADHIEELF